jgi:hypothetical protein
LKFLEEGLASENRLGLETVLNNLNRGTGSHESNLRGPQRRPRKSLGQSSFEGLQVPRGSQQAHAPIRENRRDLIDIFLGDEFVETSLRLEESGIERSLDSIVRMELELASRERGLGTKRFDYGGSETSQACWKQGRRRSLTASLEKFAAAKIDRMIRLLWPTQSDVSRKPSCNRR